MKKILFIFLFTISANLCLAQIEVTKSDFPNYQGVVQIGNLTINESYPKIKSWVATNFVSANDVIQLDDKENGKMIIKGNTIVWVKSVGLNVDMRVSFSLTIDVKDERFRYTYQVTDITSGSPSKSSMNQMNKNNRMVNGLKEDISAAFNALIEDLRSSILNASSDNW